MPDDIPLTGGVMAGAVRIGDTVHREAPPTVAAVRELLTGLHARGFHAAPRDLGLDDQGRQVLSFVPGRAGHPPITADLASDEALVSAARVIRRFHDVSAGLPGLREDEEVFCHNDLAPFNLVYQGRSVVAIIDWDLASPGRRVWDLAYAAWRLVPLHRPAYAEPLGWPPLDRARRLRLFVDAYGLGAADRELLVPLVRERMVETVEGMRRLAEEGRLEELHPLEDPRSEAGDLPYLDAHRAAWHAAVTSSGSSGSGDR